MDRKVTMEKKKVALIIDNYPGHPIIDNLKSNGLTFSSLNTMPKL